MLSASACRTLVFMRIAQALSRECGLSEKQFNDLLRDIEAGLPLQFAAARVGMSHQRLRKFIANGGEGIEPFDKLYRAVQKARAVPIAEQIDNIRAAAMEPKHWQAAAWLLERLAPEDFGKTTETDVTPLEVEIIIGGAPKESDNGED